MDEVLAIHVGTATEKYPYGTLPLRDAIEIAEDSGLVPRGTLTVSRVRAYAKARGLLVKDQQRPRPHIRMATPHPNYAQHTDSSRCRQWFLKDDGSIGVQRYSRGTAAYQNKDIKGGVELFRFVLVDHTSGAVFWQYTTDETARSLLEFLYAGWAPKRRQSDGTPAPFAPEHWREWTALAPLVNLPFRGAPQILIADRGPANQSGYTRNLCERLAIRFIPAQEARANGAVEGIMWPIERRFEARLAYDPATNLDDLNRKALDFAVRWNLGRLHSRHRMTRMQAWATITDEQLRLPPPWPVFADLAQKDGETRLVRSAEAGTGLIHWEGREYRVPAGDLIAQRVAISHSPWSYPALQARAADGRVFTLTPIEKDRWGFPIGAPVLGQAYARHAETLTERETKRVHALRAEGPALTVFSREAEKVPVRLIQAAEGAEISLGEPSAPRLLNRRQFNRAVSEALQEALGRDNMLAHEGAERDRLFAAVETVEETAVTEFVEWCVASSRVSPIHLRRA